jgi:quinol-cytochrome oxidoreductase complex cytochrome b subunit
MHYTPNVAMAFASVEHIMRDVSGLVPYWHNIFFITCITIKDMASYPLG